MKELLTIIKFTVKEYIKKTSFIVVNAIMIALIIIICNIPNLINAFSSDDETEGLNIQIIDNENILGINSEAFNQIELGYNIEYFTNKSLDDIKNEIDEEKIDGAVVLKQDNGIISFDYIVKEDSAFEDTETTAETFSTIIKTIYTNKLLLESNASDELLQAVNFPVTYEIQELNEDTGNENFLVAMITSFILFFAIYFYGYSVSTSVSSEKTSRVMETLVTSTTPTKIVVGKTIAMGLVGLGQLVGLILVAVISYNIFVPSDFELISELLGTINLNVPDVLICLVFFILGYTVYAFLSAVTGATVSKVEDVQAASTPISLIALVSFYLAYFTSTMPNSAGSKFASIFPFSAAFSMPGRILAGAVTGGEIAISIIVLIITAVLLAIISIKVYSAATLHYGDRLKIKDLFKLYKQK